MAQNTAVKCLECGSNLGGDSGKDAYSHMLGCLHVTPGPIERIRESALAGRTENGKRVAHLCNAILSNDAQVRSEVIADA